MKTIKTISALLSLTMLFACNKAPMLVKNVAPNSAATSSVAASIIPNASVNNVSPKKPALTTYNVVVVLKWKEPVPMQAPVLYDSVKTTTWSVSNLGNAKYGKADTVLNVIDWFATYANDTVKFSLSENAQPWQNVYAGFPVIGKCEEIMYVNSVVKMDTVLSDITTVTSPITTLIIK